MTFMEAIKEMRKGKRMVRRAWSKTYFAIIGKDCWNSDSIVFRNDDYDEIPKDLYLEDFEAEDWEVTP